HSFTPSLAILFSNIFFFFFFNDPPPTEIYTLSLHDALPIYLSGGCDGAFWYQKNRSGTTIVSPGRTRSSDLAFSSCFRPSRMIRSEEHTSELQSRSDLVCRLLLEKKKKKKKYKTTIK